MEEVKGEHAKEIDWENYLDNYQLLSRRPRHGPGNAARRCPSFEAMLTRQTSLFDHLLWQLRLSRPRPDEETRGAAIIGNLDDDGYLLEVERETP